MSKAMPIAWHQDCLANWRLNYARAKDELARVQANVESNRLDIERYERQIARAIRLGKDKFDECRFGDK
jgi:hypothetical protein